MAAKVFSLEEYKRKRKFGGLTFPEYWGIIINVFLVMMIAISIVFLFCYKTLNQSDAKWFALFISILSILFLLKHLKKVIIIFKKRRIHQNLNYLSFYVIAITFWAGISSLFCFGITGSVVTKIKWFLFCQIFCIPNVFLLVNLSKKINYE